MLQIFAGAFVVALIWFGPRLLKKPLTKLRFRLSYLWWQHSTFTKSRLSLLNSLYEKVDGHALSRQHRDTLSGDTTRYTYGEILYESFAGILDLTSPMPGGVFYDLGCGTGKAVITAALFGQFDKAIGVEVVESLYQSSCKTLNRCLNILKTTPLPEQHPTKIKFYHNDLLEQDISDATVVFMNATCFDDPLWLRCQQKCAELPPGTRLIVISRRIEMEGFNLLHEIMASMSWDDARVSVYERISNPKANPVE